MTTPGSTSPLPVDTLPAHLAAARWFGGKGREFTVTGVTRLGEIPGGPPEPRVVVDLVEVRYDDGAEPAHELYQLPLALYEHPQERLSHAFISWHDEGPGTDGTDGTEHWVHAYDAVHDREAMAVWLAAFAAAEPNDADSAGEDRGGAAGDPLLFHRLAGHELAVDATSTPFSGEQSNSSVMFGDDALMKVFRKVTPGVNPDVEIHDALTRAGSEHVAALYGWLEVPSDDGPLQLAMLQQFLKTASDGFELALASVRGLLADAEASADGELPADEAGGDFADEAYRLGASLADVHEALRHHFPTGRRDTDALGALARTMTDRLRDATAVVPELAEHTDRLTATYAALARLPGALVQRVHGDLHLGQTLRTVVNWKIVDFEGEPAKPLADRREPDSPWRDVAGMLRSFDYAAHAVVLATPSLDPEEGEHRRDRAVAWAQRNATAFLAGYTGDRDLTADEQVLLAAYVADKAVYEAVYEARNRPGWLRIPLAALAAL